MHRRTMAFDICIWSVLVLAWSSYGAADVPSLPPPCPSEIYCHGPLIHTVQMASIYQDSKTFVDMKLKYSPNETLVRFESFMKEHEQKPDRAAVEMFVRTTFDPEGSEFEEWIPSDWKPKPRFLEKVKEPAFRDWGYKLNDVWHKLGKKMRSDVADNPDRYSIIWVPHPVIVPGGRFREFYYWDSYWIVRGLLLCDMWQTAKGMLLNFLHVVERFGFIPNGGRVYYSMRSQPPLLTPMMEMYLDDTGHLDLVRDHIGTLEAEFDFWMKNHTTQVEVDGRWHEVAVYRDASSGPRPESYREDVDNARFFDTDAKKQNFYNELKTAAESGWDFSSRWFILNETNKGNLTNLAARQIVPVDLNAIIYWNARILARFHRLLGNVPKAEAFERRAARWLQAVEAVLWHEEVGAWLDYDLQNGVKRDYFYPTNLAPLWTGCFDERRAPHIMAKVMKYLERAHLETHRGGVPTSYEHTGEQWDYPNAWPPLQHMLIVGLNASGDAAAQRLALELTRVWVRSNYKAFNETAAMYEKYDATVMGGHGGGGEYEIQLGFGWSNGVVLDLLDRYADVLTLDDRFPSPEEAASSTPRPTQPTQPTQATQAQDAAGSQRSLAQPAAVLLALLVSFAAGFVGILLYKRRASTRSRDAGATASTSKVKHPRVRYTELKNMPKDAR